MMESPLTDLVRTTAAIRQARIGAFPDVW
jgi:hypothetical protein